VVDKILIPTIGTHTLTHEFVHGCSAQGGINELTLRIDPSFNEAFNEWATRKISTPDTNFVPYPRHFPLVDLMEARVGVEPIAKCWGPSQSCDSLVDALANVFKALATTRDNTPPVWCQPPFSSKPVSISKTMVDKQLTVYETYIKKEILCFDAPDRCSFNASPNQNDQSFFEQIYIRNMYRLLSCVR